jgi:hypothetical protein
LGTAGRFDWAVPRGQARTGKDTGLIAYSPDGLEFALPLKHITVGGGQTLRIMFVESGSFGKKESYNWATYRLKGSH